MLRSIVITILICVLAAGTPVAAASSSSQTRQLYEVTTPDGIFHIEIGDQPQESDPADPDTPEVGPGTDNPDPGESAPDGNVPGGEDSTPGENPGPDDAGQTPAQDPAVPGYSDHSDSLSPAQLWPNQPVSVSSGEIWDGRTADGFAGGDGTESSPYRISNGAELAYLAEICARDASQTREKHYALVSDIYLNDTSDFANWPSASPVNTWEPIGTCTLRDHSEAGTNPYAFQGFFNGGGYTIHGAYLSSSDGNAAGLFGCTENARINSVRMERSYFRCTCQIGGISGCSHATSFYDCSLDGIVSGDQAAGGIVGLAAGGSFIGCRNRGIVECPDSAGGIIGSAAGQYVYVSRCSNSAMIHGTQDGTAAGGIIGRAEGTSELQAADCLNTGEVAVGSSSGGIAGSLSRPAAFRRCVDTGRVFADRSAGAIAGNTADASVHFDSCYFLAGTAAGASGSSDQDSGTSLTDAQFTNPTNFQGLDFSEVWTAGSDGRPALRAVPPSTPASPVEPSGQVTEPPSATPSPEHTEKPQQTAKPEKTDAPQKTQAPETSSEPLEEDELLEAYPVARSKKLDPVKSAKRWFTISNLNPRAGEQVVVRVNCPWPSLTYSISGSGSASIAPVGAEASLVNPPTADMPSSLAQSFTVTGKPGDRVRLTISGTCKNDGKDETFTREMGEIRISAAPEARHPGEPVLNGYLTVEPRGSEIRKEDLLRELSKWIKGSFSDNASVNILKGSASVDPSVRIATGMRLEAAVPDGPAGVYEIVALGDPSGSGTMSVTQLVRIARFVGSKSENAQENSEARASDLNADGTISLSDLVVAAKYLREADPKGPAYSEKPEAAACVSDNLYDLRYDVRATPVYSHLYTNDSGGLTRVEFMDGSLLIEDYDRDFNLVNSRCVYPELPLWGGFHASEDAFFVVTGQKNSEEDPSKEVIRVEKYDRNWHRIGAAALYGANTEEPFASGTVDFAESGGTLYIRTCHRMWKHDDGKNHQANMMMSVVKDPLEISDSFCGVDLGVGYVSHSFSQQILACEDGTLVALDHGDASPRAFALQKYLAKAGLDFFLYPDESNAKGTEISEFPGEYGRNATGASSRGLAETKNAFIVAYNQDQTGGVSFNDPREIYLAAADRSDFGKVTITQITHGKNAWTPCLVPTGPDGGYVMWGETAAGAMKADRQFRYVSYDENGKPGTIQSADAALSDCVPIAWNGKYVWYVTDKSEPVFYALSGGKVSQIA